MIAMGGVAMSAVDVIGVVSVLDGDVPAAGTMAVRVREMSHMVRRA